MSLLARDSSGVAICTGRVEAKPADAGAAGVAGALQSARGVWRQRLRQTMRDAEVNVAICTGRVEAKAAHNREIPAFTCCNLHGACGGKGALQFHPYY